MSMNSMYLLLLVITLLCACQEGIKFHVDLPLTKNNLQRTLPYTKGARNKDDETLQIIKSNLRPKPDVEYFHVGKVPKMIDWRKDQTDFILVHVKSLRKVGNLRGNINIQLRYICTENETLPSSESLEITSNIVCVSYRLVLVEMLSPIPSESHCSSSWCMAKDS